MLKFFRRWLRRLLCEAVYGSHHFSRWRCTRCGIHFESLDPDRQEDYQ